jgi:hypothetical protein
MEVFPRHECAVVVARCRAGLTTVMRVLGAGPPTTDHSEQLGLEAPPPIDHDDAAVCCCRRRTVTAVPSCKPSITFGKWWPIRYLWQNCGRARLRCDVHAMGATVRRRCPGCCLFAADEAVTESTLLHLLSGSEAAHEKRNKDTDNFLLSR